VRRNSRRCAIAISAVCWLGATRREALNAYCGLIAGPRNATRTGRTDVLGAVQSGAISPQWAVKTLPKPNHSRGNGTTGDCVVLWAENLVRKSITPRTGRDYVRLARALFPTAEPFPASRLTEEYVERVLLAIPNVTESTRGRYAAAWRLCVTFLRRRVPELADPFFSRASGYPRTDRAVQRGGHTRRG